MINRWNEERANACNNDLLALRIYSSRLLGMEPDLVLHGGGNTSVKITASDIFGEQRELLYVKGSGWDLATIEAAGFAPVGMDMLHKLADLEELSDSDMVRCQRAAMTDPGAPNPSVEAILHAVIPARFVDHTHADAIVTITNTPGGAQRITELFGDRVLVIPYVMPGFALARKVYEMTRNTSWDNLEGMILLHHGIFTFHDHARESYDRMIRLVSEAETYLEQHGATSTPGPAPAPIPSPIPATELSALRKAVSEERGVPVLAMSSRSQTAVAFSDHTDLKRISQQGPLTPDHVLRTKRVPLLHHGQPQEELTRFRDRYTSYFDRHSSTQHVRLDTAPRWAVSPGHGILAFGHGLKEASIILDITEHTANSILKAEALDRWQALPEKDIFEVEYWELEQAKLSGRSAAPPFQGRIALVTGAASGIGRACTEQFLADGAVVAALDRTAMNFSSSSALEILCDLTDPAAVQGAVTQCVRHFGGLDMVVSNAGVFPASAAIASTGEDQWQQSLDINLTSHRRLLTESFPFLANGVDPSVVIIGSKNVAAPGPGAAAYSVAKAGLVQLARLAAIEMAEKGIRVNVLHPNAVFDTALWTEDILAARAAHYGLSLQEYKKDNLLGTEVRSVDVARMAALLCSESFSRTTGCQISVDGGNIRVI